MRLSRNDVHISGEESRTRGSTRVLFSIALALFGLATCLPVGHAQNAPSNGATEEVAEEPALPANFDPPKEIDPQYQIDDELPVADFKREYSAYQRILFYGVVKTDEDRKLIRDGIQWRVARMTLKENRESLPTLRGEILRDLQRCSAAKNAPMDSRDVFLAILVEELGKLLDKHLAVRLNAAILLTELNLREEDPSKGQVEQPFVPAAIPLLAILTNPDQREAVKIWAVKGLVRISPDPQVKNDLRYQIAKGLLDELRGAGNASIWYQMRLVEGLGLIGTIEDRDKRPAVVQALAKVMVDSKYHPIVRTGAAHSLGRAPLDEKINVSLLAIEIVRLAVQMAEQAEKDPKAVYWKQCFWQLYLAFRPANDVEKAKQFGLLEQSRKPALASHRKTIEESYQQVLPLVQGILGSKTKVRISDQLKSIQEWLNSNPPKDNRIAPGEEPIITVQPMDTPPVKS